MTGISGAPLEQGKLYVQSSHLPGACIGYFFIIIGLLLLVSVFFGSSPLDSNTLEVAFVVAGVILFGLCMGFSRYYIQGEENKKHLSCWRGVFGVGLKRKYDVSDCEVVQIEQVIRGVGKSRTANHILSVDSHEVMLVVDYCEARQIGEVLSRFLKRPLCDHVGGGGVKRDPESLDWSVRERLSREGKTPRRGKLSKSSLLKHEESETEHRIILPARGLSGESMLESIPYLAAGAFTFLTAFITLFVFHDEPAIPSAVSFGISTVIVIGTLLVACKIVEGVWAALFGHEEIVVTPKRLAIESHGLWQTKVNEFDGDEVEEVISTEGDEKIVIRSDQKIVSVGAGLEKADLRFIRLCIEYALCARS